MVHNPNYLVFLNCHECGQELMVDAKEFPPEPEPEWEEPEPDDYYEEAEEAPISEPPRRDPAGAVLVFCPMCGDLVPDYAVDCEACGEPLPDDFQVRPARAKKKTSRRFRRQARVVGILWFLLAYFLWPGDFWVDLGDWPVPDFVLNGALHIPSFPLFSTALVCLGAFALLGQFWPIAFGAAVNYTVLFFVIWNPDILLMGFLGGVIVMTHTALNTGTTTAESSR